LNTIPRPSRSGRIVIDDRSPVKSARPEKEALRDKVRRITVTGVCEAIGWESDGTPR
jgi:hypothetical protein